VEHDTTVTRLGRPNLSISTPLRRLRRAKHSEKIRKVWRWSWPCFGV